jgi:ferredoxin--NADP+ reductase
VAFVIDGSCCKDASCVEVCPAQCIHPRPGEPGFGSADQLYIDPKACIDCGACVIECPVGAITHENELVGTARTFADVNRRFFERSPTKEPVAPYDNGWIVDAPPRPDVAVAIVGAGAAGCYLAAELSDRGVVVDIFEALDDPFGLVRYGVAPDHQETKEVGHLFGSVLARPHVTLHAGIEVGQTVRLEELRDCYHAVVWATGADVDKTLPIPGADLPGVVTGRKFANWINGHPGVADGEVRLTGSTAVILGMGNVALDAARALLNPVEAYSGGVLPAAVAQSLASHRFEQVFLVARRGLDSVAFSYSQLLALSSMPDLHIRVKGLVEETHRHDAEQDGRARTADSVRLLLDAAVQQTTASPAARSLTFIFNAAVSRINGRSQVESVELTASARPEHSPGGLRDTGTDRTVLETSNVIMAIGQARRDRFTPDRPAPGRLPMPAGYEDALITTGFYQVGWARRGGRGVVGSNKFDARVVADHILKSLDRDELPAPSRFRHVITARH